MEHQLELILQPHTMGILCRCLTKSFYFKFSIFIFWLSVVPALSSLLTCVSKFLPKLFSIHYSNLRFWVLSFVAALVNVPKTFIGNSFIHLNTSNIWPANLGAKGIVFCRDTKRFPSYLMAWIIPTCIVTVPINDSIENYIVNSMVFYRPDPCLTLVVKCDAREVNYLTPLYYHIKLQRARCYGLGLP